MAQTDCPKCDGTGWKIVEGEREVQPAEQRISVDAAKQAEADGVKAFAVVPANGLKNKASAGLPRMAVPCECTFADKRSRVLERARLPKRYQHCNFESYDTDQYDRETHGADAERWNRSLAQAKIAVQGFARDFPIATEQHGLMLMGTCGVGKTHLAVAALEEIILRGHSGLFYDYRELLKEIQDSYNPESNSTEMDVLDPVLKAEILLLDDLGSSKPSLWALETVGHILNTRYNEHRVTLLTTNFLDAAQITPRVAGGRPSQTEDTLSDRVGARIRSRLYEMCRTVEIFAPDYRREVRHAGHFQ